MTDPRPSEYPPDVSLDQQLKWPAVSIVVFALAMGSLAALVVWSVLPHPPTVGLPDDSNVRTARTIAAAASRLDVRPYRFTSEFLGAPPPDEIATSDPAALAEAERLLHAARWRRPLDPRITSALASLELARGRLRHAEAGFRRACDVARHYPNAHLGLGVTLALEADRARDPLLARGLRLRAVAQFRAVEAPHPDATAALYDLAWVLDQLGAPEEARAAAAAYVERAPGDPAGERLLARTAAR